MSKERIPSTTIQQIKDRSDLRVIISRYVPLNRQNKGLCPFHPETSPSFTINQRKNFWYCFSCNKGGDIFAFIQRIEGCSFKEAVSILASETGVPLPKSERFKGYISLKHDMKKKKLAIFETAMRFLKQAEREVRNKILEERKHLPKQERWDSWDSKDYLKDQFIDYRFDLYDEQMKKVYGQMNEYKRRIYE